MSGLRLPLRFLSVLLLFCVFASSFFITNALVVGLSACRSSQIQALMEFKREFDSSRCNQRDYVNGIECNNATGAVKKLQLPSGCLRGTLKPNSSLFGLHHLRYLNLSYNDFTSSSLPSGFGNLNKLEVLSLSSNGFIGQVPSSFSNLSRLTELYLSQNKLTGSFPLVQNLSKLSILELDNNNFSGAIPSYLFLMPFLSILDLTDNHLTGPIEIPNSSSSSRLKRLSLGGNNFEGKYLESISKFITLEDLDLSFLNESYPIDLSLFSSLKYLTYLDLSGNSLSPTSLSSDSVIPLSMEILFLWFCNISEFPNILKPLQNLQLIDISSNKLKGKVHVWLLSLPRLKTLIFANNSLNGFEGSTEVLVNSPVQILDFSFNSFEGALPNLPLSIGGFFVEANSFTGHIPLSICNRSYLIHLIMSNNKFTGPIPQCLSKFEIVKLRKNNLEGSIPNMFYVGASLRTLDVGHNRLNGKLPKSFLNCSSLKFLSVEHNRIEDTFPFWLKALPDLKVLILRSNKLYGHISPPDQSPLAFPELQILETSDNNFTGSISPSYFVNWKASSLQMNEDGSICWIIPALKPNSTWYVEWTSRVRLAQLDIVVSSRHIEWHKRVLDYSRLVLCLLIPS